MPAHYARHQLAGRGPRRRRQAPLSGRRVGAPPTPPPPGPPARCGAHVRATRNSRTQHRGTTRAGAGGFACAGGTWGYRVTARRTPALATERLGRLHLSTLPRLGDVERVPRVPPLAPRGNGKATTYRAPLATPGVGAGLTAATISSAVRAFSRSAIRRARRSVSALILAVAPSSGGRRRPPCRRRSPCRRAPRLRLPHRAPPHAIGGQEHRVRRRAVARLVAPQRGALRLVGSRGLVLQCPGATGGRRDQRPRQIPAYALTVLEYVSLAFRFRLDRRLRSAVGPKRTGRIVRICVIRECPPRTVAYTPPLATGHFSPRFRCPPPPPRQPRAGGGYRYCRGCGRLVSTDTLPLARCRSVSGSSAGSSVASMRAGNACSHHRAPPRKTAPGPPGARPGRRGHHHGSADAPRDRIWAIPTP